jgi:hypothetical protein
MRKKLFPVVLAGAFLTLGHRDAEAGVFIRGDTNGDGAVDIADAVAALRYLFVVPSLSVCLDAADANDDGTNNIADVVFTLGYLFADGTSPWPPFGGPGCDPTRNDPYTECDCPPPRAGNDFYRTVEMTRPRYEHAAATLDDGTVLIVGGSDERCFTTIDLAEIYDQSMVVEPAPPSGTGGWIDTDFEGEELRLQDGGRVFHTVTPLGGGSLLITGGAMDGIMGEVYEHPERFDRSTRKFTLADAIMREPRFHHTAVAHKEDEVLYFGGQIHVNITTVDPNYPPSDPRFIVQVNTFPSTRSIERFDESLASEDGLGNFTEVTGVDLRPALLSLSHGRAIHGTVRIAGLDLTLGNEADIMIHIGGIATLSPAYAPRTKLRRLRFDTTVLGSLDVYDAFTRTCFLAPGVVLKEARAHGVMTDTLGWHSDTTLDGIRGLSNVFIVAGGTLNDYLPTEGAYETEEFAATFSGFGPGGGISLMRTEPVEGDTIETVIRDVLGSEVNGELAALVTPAIPGALPAPGSPNNNALLNYDVLVTPPVPEGTLLGRYFGLEALFNPASTALFTINRVHTNLVRLLREKTTPSGSGAVGTLFCGGGGYFYVVPAGAQVQVYDQSPVPSAEFFDPYFCLINGFFQTQRNPDDLATMRTYFSVKTGTPLPEPGNEGTHPHPTGVDGAWLIADGYVPGDSFEGYEWIPPFTSNTDDYRVRVMEKGRAWHTSSVVPGADGKLGTVDDQVLFAGGGNEVLAWGGEAVVPSAIIYIPPPSRE